MLLCSPDIGDAGQESEAAGPDDLDGDRAPPPCEAESEEAVVVLPPAPDGRVAADGAAVVPTDGDLGDVGEDTDTGRPHDLDRCRAGGDRAVAQLSLVVLAPAGDGAIGDEGATVSVAGVDEGDVLEVAAAPHLAHPLWSVLRGHLSDTQLTVFPEAPAPRTVAGRHRTGVSLAV